MLLLFCNFIDSVDVPKIKFKLQDIMMRKTIICVHCMKFICDWSTYLRSPIHKGVETTKKISKPTYTTDGKDFDGF